MGKIRCSRTYLLRGLSTPTSSLSVVVSVPVGGVIWIFPPKSFRTSSFLNWVFLGVTLIILGLLKGSLFLVLRDLRSSVVKSSLSSSVTPYLGL